MTDGEWIKLFALFGLSLVVCLSVLAWKGMSVLSSLSRRNMRASESERRTWLEMIQQAVERRDHPTGETMRMHASERMERARLQAGVDRLEVVGDNGNRTATRMDGETAYGSETTEGDAYA